MGMRSTKQPNYTNMYGYRQKFTVYSGIVSGNKKLNFLCYLPKSNLACDQTYSLANDMIPYYYKNLSLDNACSLLLALNLLFYIRHLLLHIRVKIFL